MVDKNTIYNEMMVHIPLCTHKEPSSVLVVGKNENIDQELNKHNVTVTYSDELNIENTFDIIIYNDVIKDELTMANINRCLNQEEGIFVCLSTRFEKDNEQLIKDIKTVGKDFWICMPFRFGHTMAILASKKYHPQSDIILDRSDFLDCEYYHTELQNASFIHPAYIQKALTGIAKR